MRGEAFEVGVVRLLSAAAGELMRARIAVEPNIGMPISHGEAEAVVMSMGGGRWEVEPGIRSGIGYEESIIDASLVFINEHPQLGRAAQFGVFDKERNVIFGCW